MILHMRSAHSKPSIDSRCSLTFHLQLTEIQAKKKEAEERTERHAVGDRSAGINIVHDPKFKSKAH